MKKLRIKLVLTDVDGVLTDGGMYYTAKGDIMKKFHARDGMGITILKKFGIPTMIITKEKTPMVRIWSKQMKIKQLHEGIIRKENILKDICKKNDLLSNEIAYIGDDINDSVLLKSVGLSATPSDGIDEIKQICNYVCKSKGGHGAFREFVDYILKYNEILL